MKIARSANKEGEIFYKSNIVVNKDEIQLIKGFFGTRKIKNTNLLYSAPLNNFSAEKFHINCDGIPNTVALCQTEYETKIGGFTPIPWQKAT